MPDPLRDVVGEEHRMTAPAPLNLSAMSSAWDNPTAFARELSVYYTQLEASGHRPHAHDWTERKENA